MSSLPTRAVVRRNYDGSDLGWSEKDHSRRFDYLQTGLAGQIA